MPGKLWKRLGAGILAVGLAAGCRSSKPVRYLGDAELKYYRDYAQAVEFPNVDQETPLEVAVTARPRTIKDREKDEMWDVSLMQAVHFAVGNNKLIRTRTNGGQIVANPNMNQSVYDPAIRETGPLFGNRGVEAALSDFDAQFTTSAIWGRNARVSNSLLPFPGFVSTSETANFSTGVAKTFATGGTFGVSHNWDYLGTNNPGTMFPSSYTGDVTASFRQPLWAGAGVEYTRIAGPARAGFGAITGVGQGVVIARINADISVADFESSVTTMVKDVEDLYWDLYLAYRQYDAELANGRSALRTWREVKARKDVGAVGGNASAEAQARENYFETRSRIETALATLYTTEINFRRICGLPVNDGKRIRPVDSPLEGEYIPHWESCLSEALTRRVELRRQKWQIKSLELQHVAARSLTNPRLDFVSSYQVNGFGDKLISGTTNDGLTSEGYNSAYSSLGRSDQTGWGLGLEMSMPIGFRAAHAQVRNIELQLMKARAGLASQELEISHELASAVQTIDAAYVTARTQFDRLTAAELRVRATEAEYQAQVKDATLDLVLRAQAARALAEIAYFNSLIRYNQALADMHLRKGTILERSNVQLEEGEWSPVAKEQALRRAWARSFARPEDRTHTEPGEFANPAPYPKTDLYGPATSIPPQPYDTPVDSTNYQETTVDPAPVEEPTVN